MPLADSLRAVFGLLARLVLAFVLAGSAVLKLASPGSSRAALATFDLEDERLRWIGWAILVATELGLAAAIVAGVEGAEWLAAALMAMFAAALVGAIMRGRAGAPCACFGSRSTVGWGSVARNLALAACFAALPFLPERSLSTDEWLGLGLVVALLACVGLVIAVLALAREVGMLRLRLGPSSALEIAEEGPALGEPTGLARSFGRIAETGMGLAVFTSEGCRVCHGLRPAVATLSDSPVIDVAVFDEVAEHEVWSELGVPGSPFAIAVDPEGAVLAKGTFNNLAQLESVIATAERRRAEEAVSA